MANAAYTSKLNVIGLNVGCWAVYVVQPLHR